MTGWEVAKHARTRTPGRVHDRRKCSYWGSMGVPNSVLMIKPFAPAQIVSAVSQLLNMEQSS